MAGWENPTIPSGTELGYVQTTANIPITDLAEATGTALLTLPAITFDGSPVWVEAFGEIAMDTNALGDICIASLFEGAAQITRLLVARATIITVQDIRMMASRFKFTPTAGAHTYKLAAFVSSLTGTPAIVAGIGGAGQPPAAYLRVTKA